jgi:prepilin-type N-terminal cleavage/methylation domain-containing protein
MKLDEHDRSRGRPLVGSETSRGFTLIELLVVIAIIGILAAMIMAAVSKAKNSASKATDINNLHQIMIALQVYASDDGDVLPPPNWDNGASGSPKGWLYEIDSNATGTDRFKVKTGLFWPTLQNPKIYFCPMDNNPGETRYSESMGTDMERPQQISSYAMNGAVIGYNFEVYPPVKLAAMHPTDCAFWETDETDPHNFNDGANWPGMNEGVSARHNQGAIQAAFDTSVSYVRLQDWYKDADDPGKNRLWCYPNSPDGGGPNGHSQ